MEQHALSSFHHDEELEMLIRFVMGDNSVLDKLTNFSDQGTLYIFNESFGGNVCDTLLSINTNKTIQ